MTARNFRDTSFRSTSQPAQHVAARRVLLLKIPSVYSEVPKFCRGFLGHVFNLTEEEKTHPSQA